MIKLIFICMVFLSGCSEINRKLGLSDDNIGEEVIEDIIKEETGIDVDLTPESPEKKYPLLFNYNF